MMDAMIQEIIESRQRAENEFIEQIKTRNPISETSEKNLRDGFLAGFYEAYNKLPELNKLKKKINTKTKERIK